MYVYHYSAEADIPLWPGESTKMFLEGILQRDAPVSTAEDYRQVRDAILDANPEDSSRASLVVHSLSLLHCDPGRKEQKTETDRHKQAIRHLATCRYYLPATVYSPDAVDSIWTAIECLTYDEHERAFDAAEALGVKHKADGDYWDAVALSAECLGLSDRAARLRAHSHQTGGCDG